MNLKSLKMLVKLADKGSFSAVAEELDVSQPAVSMQINSLEEKFSVKLVSRQDGGISLTPAGKVLNHHAREMLKQWDQLELEIKKIKDEHFGKLNLGVSTIPSTYMLPDLMAEFYKEFPEVEISLKVGDSKEAIQKLNSREVDVIIVGARPQDSRNFYIAPIYEDELKLIVPAEDSLAEQKSVGIKDIIRRKVLIREQGSGTRSAMMKGLKDNGINEPDLNIRAVLESNEAVISAVEAGLGISFISRLAAEKAENQGRVTQVDIEDIMIARKFYLATYKSRKEELLIKEFVKIAQDFA